MAKVFTYYSFVALVLLTLFGINGCKRYSKHAKVENGYLLTWKDSTNFIFIQNFNFSPKHFLGKKGSLVHLSGDSITNFWVNFDNNRPYIKYLDTILDPLPKKYNFPDIPKFLSESPFYHFPMGINVDQNIVIDSTYSRIKVEAFNADYVSIQNDDSLDIRLNGGNIEQLKIEGTGSRKPPLNLTQLASDSLHQGQIKIADREILTVTLNQHIEKLTLANCVIKSDRAYLSSNADVDTLVLDNVQFDSKRNILISGLAGTKNDHKIKLICIGTDPTKLDLDYRFFEYVPLTTQDKGDFNTQYSADKKFLNDLIANQKTANNEGGRIKALIDAAKYEDSQSQFRVILIPLKNWWNGYGYVNSKVISATLELFLITVFINFFFFSKLLNSYCFKEIKKSYDAIQQISVKNSLAEIFLCVVYTGFIFFGLKLELDKLKLSNRGVALWIIIQYLIGIVAMAYIANLIVGK